MQFNLNTAQAETGTLIDHAKIMSDVITFMYIIQNTRNYKKDYAKTLKLY